MTGVSHPASCPGWRRRNRLRTAELMRCRAASPVCTLRGKGAGFELAALWRLLRTTGLLPSAQRMGFLKEAPSPVFRPGRETSSLIPALPFPKGKQSHRQHMKRDLVPNGTKERSDNGGGRKAAGRKGTEPNLTHLSLNLCVPGAFSVQRRVTAEAVWEHTHSTSTFHRLGSAPKGCD